MAYKFRWLHPADPTSGYAAFPVLREAHFKASFAFASNGVITQEGAEYEFEYRTVEEIEECLDIIAAILKPATGSEQVESTTDNELPLVLVDPLHRVFQPVGYAAKPFKLRNGRTVETPHLFAAACLAQCDRVAGAIVDGDAERAAQLMWEVHKAVRVLDLPLDYFVSKALVRSELSRPGAVAKNAENRQLKADALAYYEAHHSDFKSKADAAHVISSKVVPVKLATVRRWLQGFNPQR